MSTSMSTRVLSSGLVLCALVGAPSWAADCLGMNGGPGDIDGDGFARDGDCDDQDPALWSSPGEVTGLLATASPGVAHRFVWNAGQDLGGVEPSTYEVLRSADASNFLDHPSATCLDVGGTDLEAADPTVPAPGEVLYYLVRARSDCGPGTLGPDSNGLARPGRDCDCAVLCDDGYTCTADRCDDGSCVHEPIPPVLLREPSSTHVCDGDAARFEVAASGTGTLSYEWHQGGGVVGNDAPLLELTGLTPAANDSDITVTVTDTCSSVTSSAARLTVFSNPDSCAGGLDGQEAPNGAGDQARGKNIRKNITVTLFKSDKSHGLHLHSGELHLHETDLAIAGRGFDFEWTRHYRSRLWRSTAMGVGWTHRYDRRITPDSAHPGHLLVWADSRSDSFAPNPLGCYEAPGFFEELCPQPGGSYVLTFPDRMTWTFAPLDGSPAQGLIVQARDRFDNAMTFSYNGIGQLVTITDTLGRDVTVAYNARNLISSITDFFGRTVTYHYFDGLDDLKSVTSPPVIGTPTSNDFEDGKIRTYTYSQGSPIGELNHNLLTIADGEGEVWLENAYTTEQNPSDAAFDRVSQQRILPFEIPDDVSTVSYTYVSQVPSPANNLAVSKTIVNDGMGNVAEYFYDAASHLIIARDFTGRAPDPTAPTDDMWNRPGVSVRLGDPLWFETRYEYDANSLVTRVVEPNGNEILLTHDSANPSPRKRGDVLQVQHLPGPLGGDQPSISESWTHGTDFGTDWGGRGDSYRSKTTEAKVVLGGTQSSSCMTGPPAGEVQDCRPNVYRMAGPPGPQLTGIAVADFDGDGPLALPYDPPTAVRPPPNVDIVLGRGSGNQKGWDGKITARDWLEDDRVSSASRRGVVGGCGGGNYCPQNPVARRQVVSGCGGGNYCPQDPVARRQVVSGCGGGNYCPQNPLAHRGVVGGCGGGNYCPQDPPQPQAGVAVPKFLEYMKKGAARADGGADPPQPQGVAIPKFIDLTSEAKKAAERADVGAIRAGVLNRYSGGLGADAAFPTSYTDGSGHTSTMVYSPAGALTDVTAPTVVTGTLGGMPQTIHHHWTHNAHGQVTQYTDPAGRVTSFTYHTAGWQLGHLQDVVVDPGGLAETTTYDYDQLGHVTKVVRPGGIDVDLHYNALDQLVRMSHGTLPYEVDWYYDAEDRLKRVDLRNVDETGAVRPNHHYSLLLSYFETGDKPFQKQREIGPGQCVTEQFEWDANGQLTLWRSGVSSSGEQPTNVVGVRHDERGFVYRVTDAEGDSVDVSTKQLDYDGNGNLAALHEGLEAPGGPNVATWQHDGYDRVTGSLDAEGNAASVHYDARGQTVSSRLDGEIEDGVSGPNVRLYEATYVRDEVGRIVTTEIAHFDVASGAAIGDGSSTSRLYHDASSRVIRDEDDNGHGNDYVYDAAGRLSLMTNPRGDTASHTYDASSNVTAVTEVELSDIAGVPPVAYVTQFEYDDLNRRTAVVDNVGNRSETDFDSCHLAVRMRDQMGNVTRTTYDGLSRPTRSERDLTDTGTGAGTVVGTVVTTQAWDDSSRVVSATDETGNTTAFGYNGRDQLIAVQRADGTTRTRSLDVHGNEVVVIDENGSVQNLAYDRLNRLGSRSIARAPGVLGTTGESYAYDGASRMVRADDDDVLVLWAYDSRSSVLQESQQVVAGPVRSVTSTRDGKGNVTAITYPSGLFVTYSHDPIDRIKTVAAGPALVASYDYAGPDTLAQIIRSNGVTTQYVRDGVKRIVQKSELAGAPLVDQTFSWSLASDQLSWSVPSASRSHAYEYDSLHRLQQSSRTTGGPPQIVTYELDEFGQRVSVTGGPDAGDYTMSPTLPVPGDFQVHQYTTTPEGARQYDEKGDTLVLDGGSATERTLAYDYRGQIATITRPGATLDYGRDALGRVLSRAGLPNLESVYRGSLEIEQYSGGTLQADFIYGVGGTPLQMVEQVDLNGDSVLDQYFFHTNSEGSVVAVSDQSAVVRESYDYGDFQAPLIFDDSGTPIASSAVRNPFLGGGRYWEESQFLYADGFDPRAGVCVGPAGSDETGTCVLSGTPGVFEPPPTGTAAKILICWYDQWGYWNCIIVEGQGPGMAY